MAKIRELYQEKVVPTLMKEFNLKNAIEVPKLKKVVINMGLSDAKENIKVIDTALAQLSSITGQRPVVTRAKKSISNFKIREGMPIGCKVTLRGDRMYEFLERLISMALPRIRDFRGVPRNSFDKGGNYSLGLKEQTIFPEIDIEKIDKVRGMDITIAINSKSNEQSERLLVLLGMPFREK